jgi:hypothetical protein
MTIGIVAVAPLSARIRQFALARAEDVRLEGNELCREARISLRSSFRIPLDKSKVLVLDPAEIAQSIRERSPRNGRPGACLSLDLERKAGKPTDLVDLSRFLRASRQR